VKFSGYDESGDNAIDEDGEDETAERKDVKSIHVTVINFSHIVGSQACCLINNRALRQLLREKDKVRLTL